MTNTTPRVVIIGAAGAVGHAAARGLAAEGVPFRVVGRSRDRLKAAFGEGSPAPAADLCTADAAHAPDLQRAVKGCEAVIYTVGVPYNAEGFATLPGLTELAIEASEAEGVQKFITVSNVYPYGRVHVRPVRESHPRTPCSFKGTMRRDQEDVTFGAHRRRGLHTLVLRPTDFFGPDVAQSYAKVMFEAALKGAATNLFAPADAPMDYLYTRDMGPVLAKLALRPRGPDDGYGEAYNLAGSGVITQLDMAKRIYAAVGKPFKYRVAGARMLKIAGLFSPLMRELGEMAYLYENPVLLDDSKLTALIGPVRHTPYDEGIAATLAAMR